jgi:hypothetical protein
MTTIKQMTLVERTKGLHLRNGLNLLRREMRGVGDYATKD